MSTETAVSELAALVATYRDAEHTLDVTRRRLHERIVDAVDLDGLPIPRVARAVGVSRQRIHAIIVRTEARTGA
jgi:hypothetical protein